MCHDRVFLREHLNMGSHISLSPLSMTKPLAPLPHIVTTHYSDMPRKKLLEVIGMYEDAFDKLLRAKRQKERTFSK